MNFFKKLLLEIKNKPLLAKRYWLIDKAIITASVFLFCFFAIFSIDILKYLFIVLALASIIFHYISNEKIKFNKNICLLIDILLLIVLGFVFGMIVSIGRFFVLEDYSKTLYSLFFLIYLFFILLLDSLQ